MPSPERPELGDRLILRFAPMLHRLGALHSFHKGSPEQARRLMRPFPEPLAGLLHGPHKPVPVRELLQPGLPTLRIYEGLAEGDPPGGPSLLYLHGGGFVAGDLDSHDRLCRYLAHHARALVVAVDYRRAPEHPYPAAIEDSLAAWGWMLEETTRRGLRHPGVAGDSAGGNLSIALCIWARRNGLSLPHFLGLLYPAADPTHQGPQPPPDPTGSPTGPAITTEPASIDQFANGPLLSAEDIRWFAQHYGAQQRDLGFDLLGPESTDPTATFTGLPPVLLQVSGRDPLRDEGRALATRLAERGVPVSYFEEPWAAHGVAQLIGLSESGRRMADRLAVRLADPTTESNRRLG